MRHLEDFFPPASNFLVRLTTQMQRQGGVTSPDVTQELVTLVQSPPQEPVPDGGMEAHQGAISPHHEDVSDGLILVPELPPGQLGCDVEGGVGGVQLVQGQGLQTGQADGEQVTNMDK